MTQTFSLTLLAFQSSVRLGGEKKGRREGRKYGSYGGCATSSRACGGRDEQRLARVCGLVWSGVFVFLFVESDGKW